MGAQTIYKWPRRNCPLCGRQVAVSPAGFFTRHDPTRKRAFGAPLLSCTGSLTKAPASDGSRQAELFHAQDVTPEHLWA